MNRSSPALPAALLLAASLLACGDDVPTPAPGACDGVSCAANAACDPATGNCACAAGFTLHEGQCVDQRLTDCADLSPEHATARIEKVEIRWTPEGGWQSPADCAWSCEPGYGEHPDHPGQCLQQVSTPCDPAGVATPANASVDTAVKVDVAWSDAQGWSAAAACPWICDAGFGEHPEHPGQCLQQVSTPCDPSGVSPPANASVDTAAEVAATWDDASGWSAAPACPWRCDAGFGEHPEHPGQCLQTTEASCNPAGVTTPADAHVVTGDKVRVDWDDASGWSAPAACPWACDAGFGVHPDHAGECLQQVAVPCDATGVAAPANGHVETAAQVTVTWDDAIGWSAPAACAWACAPGFGVHPSHPDACLEAAEVPCEPAGVSPPANATVDGTVTATVVWDDATGWSEAAACPWMCDAGFGVHPSAPDACHDALTVACRDQAPANAAATAASVTVTWDAAALAWSDDLCPWACLAGFGEHPSDPGACHEALSLACRDEPPANASSTSTRVTVTWDPAALAWSDDLCPWTCDRFYGEHPSAPGACHAQLTVACRDVTPANATTLSDTVTVLWDEAGRRWTDDACPWTCDAGFGVHPSDPGTCHDQLLVACRDAPPENAVSIADTVTVFWDPVTTSFSDDLCPWNCAPCFFPEGQACIAAPLFPGRALPGTLSDLPVEVFGAGFDVNTRLVWDAGGSEVTLAPISASQTTLSVVLGSALLAGPARVVPTAIELGDGTRCAAQPFVLGGVLPDTGQRACFSDVHVMVCPAEGASFHDQDAQHGWDLQLTRDQRFERTSAVSSEPVVVDHVSGLEWQGCPVGRSGSSCTTGTATQLEWQAALDHCAALSWGGHDDWALPTVSELIGLADAGLYAPALYSTAFPNAATPGHWSSTQAMTHVNQAWRVEFVSGLSSYLLKGNGGYVRCVRRADTPAGLRLRSQPVAGQPVVRDTATGLMWQGCGSGREGANCELGVRATMNWANAMAWCANLQWAGHDDWRLPDRNELETLVDYGAIGPAADLTLFPLTERLGWGYWTSTTYQDAWNKAWRVRFNEGQVAASDTYSSKTTTCDVRCVRGGLAT